MSPNRIAVRPAAARLAEGEGRAPRAQARATVIRLDREQAAAVKLWMVEELGAPSPC